MDGFTEVNGDKSESEQSLTATQYLTSYFR